MGCWPHRCSAPFDYSAPRLRDLSRLNRVFFEQLIGTLRRIGCQPSHDRDTTADWMRAIGGHDCDPWPRAPEAPTPSTSASRAVPLPIVRAGSADRRY